MSLQYAFIDWSDVANPRVRKFLEYAIADAPQGIALQNGYPVLVPSTVEAVPEYDSATQVRSRTETITGAGHSIVWTVRALTAEELEARAESARQAIEQQLPDAAIKRMLRDSINLDTATEEEVLELVSVYDQWRPNTAYATDKVLAFGADVILRVIAPGHTSQAHWNPTELPALYQVIAQPLPGELYPPWVQPLGSEDAYAVGARVNHNGQNWENESPANSFAPGVFGWKVLP